MRPLTWLALTTMVVGCESRPLIPQHPARGGGGEPRPVPATHVDKVDLLLVVDDGPGVADARAEVARQLPKLLASLADRTRPGAAADIHVAVISSSLGTAGTSLCHPSVKGPAANGGAHPLPRTDVCRGAAAPLAWVSDPVRDPKALSGPAGLTALGEAAACVVGSAGDGGCAVPQPWEAVYHFLVDPRPYAKAEVKCTFGADGDACGNNDVIVDGVDERLLAERAAFLRPDSMLAVVLVSEHDDASLHPAGKNWIPWAYAPRAMRPGWEACAALPDDLEPDGSSELTAKGCYSCFQSEADPACGRPWPTAAPNADVDARALRGFHQVQRFGFNFLWSRDRYVNAFRNRSVPDSKGVLGPNPIFEGGFRDQSLVLVTGIVGVPRKLVRDGDTPKILGPVEWEKIAGADPGKRDPYMIASIGPRPGLPRFAGDRTIDEVHGGDRDVPAGDDLQYACIAARPASATGAPDCAKDPTGPLCGPGGTQPFRKAYPGLRHARILHALGAAGQLASICDEDFGDTMAAVGTAVRKRLAAQCLNLIVEPDADGRVACAVTDVFPPEAWVGKTCETLTGAGGATAYCTPGKRPCRRAGEERDVEAVAKEISLRLRVPDAVAPKGTEMVSGEVQGGNVVVRASDGTVHLVCEVRQLAGGGVDPAVGAACRTDPSWATSLGGFCYATAREVVGEVCFARGSPVLRFVGDAVPRPTTQRYVLCTK